ncbi:MULTISPECIES: hypothetical protein [Sporomusaceae]|uniref:hypothetical protein n=1 Tax=Sporomusaceae TaxID=1843490 RepID=UPI0006BB76D0|nr:MULTISPECIES: hypothetical protein [Sporomusaceae]
MAGKTVTVVMTERMYGQLAKCAAVLSAKPRRNGKTREVSVEDALLLAAMLYIEEYLYRQEDGRSGPAVSCSPPG